MVFLGYGNKPPPMKVNVSRERLLLFKDGTGVQNFAGMITRKTKVLSCFTFFQKVSLKMWHLITPPYTTQTSWGNIYLQEDNIINAQDG